MVCSWFVHFFFKSMWQTVFWEQQCGCPCCHWLISSAGDSSGRSGDNHVGRGVVNCDTAIGKLPPRWTEWDLVYFCWNGLGLPHQWFGVWSIRFFSVNIWHCQHQAVVSILLFLDLEPNKECFKKVIFKGCRPCRRPRKRETGNGVSWLRSSVLWIVSLDALYIHYIYIYMHQIVYTCMLKWNFASSYPCHEAQASILLLSVFRGWCVLLPVRKT